MNEKLTEMREILQARGHEAEEVQNSPVDMLNVWLGGEGRNPDATVMYDEEGWSWGHKWEHTEPADSAPLYVTNVLLESLDKRTR